MQVNLMGRRWFIRFVKLGREQAYGSCDDPRQRSKAIRIDPRLEDEQLLEVTIHELLHACDWRADEEHIDQQARDMARVLWRLGWRQSASQK